MSKKIVCWLIAISLFFISASSFQANALEQWGPWLSVTTEWHQGATVCNPFAGHWNSECPYAVPSTCCIRRPVGCVATATAQIVNYWKYPQSIGFSDAEQICISGLNHSFEDYSDYGFPSLIELNNNLSSLLYNGNESEEDYLSFGLGVKLRMDYGVCGSSSSTSRVDNVLRALGFGQAIADSGSDAWSLHESEIIDDLKNARPVQIGMKKSGATRGHSVIVDGYRSDDYFYVNMGWGGSSNAWYDISNINGYDIIHTVVYNISKYQGWSQVGADPQNSYHAIYSAPIEQPSRKSRVSLPSGLTDHKFSHLVVGTGGKTYASISPQTIGSTTHPRIFVIDQFGTQKQYIEEDTIEISHSNTPIAYLCQNSRGEVFFSSGQGGPGATNSKLYRLNPRTETTIDILTHSSPDSGIFERPIKVDRDDYLYFVIEPRYAGNYGKFYAVSRTGSPKWTEKTFATTAEFHRTIPAIDEDRDRVYLNYFDKTDGDKGTSQLIAFKRSDGTQVFDVTLPNIPTHYASEMAGAPSIGPDGTVYIGAYTHLYAYSSDGTKLDERSFDPAYTYWTPAIGNDGTLYVPFGKLNGETWEPGHVRALDPDTLNSNWEMALPLGPSDHMGEIYASSNDMVVYSYDQGGVYHLGGVKDNGTSYGTPWDMVGGGKIAFGPGQTIVSIPPDGQSIYEFTDYGEPGDPYGEGMDYADNSQPSSPSSPAPADGTVDQPLESVTLSWSCSDPDGHSLKYDVYVCAMEEGEEADMVPVATGLTSTSYTLTNLQAETQHLWTVVATDGQAIAEGPTWSFTTQEAPRKISNLVNWNGNLVADFGDNGMWYHNGTKWNWMTNDGAVGQMVVWDGKLVVDFGPDKGIWYYDTAWHWMTNKSDPNMMVAWNNGLTEVLVVDFGAGQRIYTYDGSWHWFKNKDGVADMTVWNNKLIIDFGGGRGVYNYDGSWNWMTNKDDVNLMLPWDNGTSEVLVVDFGGGRRIYTYDGSWNWFINKDDVNDMVVWNQRLVVDFGGGRLVYTNDGSWNWLTNKDDVSRMVPWNNGSDLAVDFGSGRNMYNYDGSWHWIKNANDVPEMVDWGNRLAVDFGFDVGVYYYDGSWHRLNDWSTEEQPSMAYLYFPHIDTESPWQTEIAVNNITDSAVTGTFRAYTNNGQLVETKNVTLPARGRDQIAIASEFSSHGDIGYIIFASDTAGIQGYTELFQDGLYRTAIPAVKEVNTSDIYIPHIASNSSFWTILSLVNTTSTAKNMTINFNDGRSVAYPIDANEHKSFTVASLFGGQPQDTIDSGVITNASGVIGLELFGNNEQMDGLLLTEDTVSTLYYPHVADTSTWWTGIVAYNPSTIASNLTISPYSANGTALTPVNLLIAGGEKFVGLVNNLGLDSQTAWFKIDSTQPLSGFELFGSLNGDLLTLYAEGSGMGCKQGIFARIEKNGWTDIAFVNTEYSSAVVTLTAYNDSGAEIAFQTISVDSLAYHFSTAEAIFSPQNIDNATYIAFTSDKNMVGFQLTGSSDDMMLDLLPVLD